MRLNRELQQDIDNLLDVYLWFRFLKKYDLILDYEFKGIECFEIISEPKDEVEKEFKKILESVGFANFIYKPYNKVDKILLTISLNAKGGVVKGAEENYI